MMTFVYGKQNMRTLERAQENNFLLTNALGGYASVTAGYGVPRCDQGLLVAAVKAPNVRINMVHRLQENTTNSKQSFLHRDTQDIHKQIEDTSDNSGKFSGEKLLGVDPASGKNVYVKIGRFGPVAQIGDTDSEEKPKFAGLNKNQSIETITLEEVLDLFAFPRNLGEYEGSEIQVAIGRFGPYVKHNNIFYGLTKLDDPAMVSYERAIDIIESKRKADLDNVVSTYPENEDLKVLKGRFGIYISFNKQNYKIPKTYDATNLTYQDCMDIINDPNNASKKRGKKS